MATHAGTGYSSATDPAEAGREAAQSAIADLGGSAPDLVFTFASTSIANPTLLRSVREHSSSAPLIGCTTAGQFNEEHIGRESVAVMAIRSDEIRFHTGFHSGVKGDGEAAVKGALEGFSASARAARSEGLNHATCIVCTDGLAGNGEDLVETIHRETGMLAQVVGGAAADDAKFEKTEVFFDESIQSDSIALAYAFSKTPIGLGVRHGLSPACPSMIVTRAKDNVIYEIDGKPALAAYEKFAESIGEPLSSDNREAFMMTHEIGMLIPPREYKIRAPLKANADGSLVMASEVPTGASISIMRGTKDALVDAAEQAARSAMDGLQGGAPAAVLAFDCICRRIFLGDEYRRQVDAFRRVVGSSVPILGWETYGEIAMASNQPTGWHNSTTVLAILPGGNA